MIDEQVGGTVALAATVVAVNIMNKKMKKKGYIKRTQKNERRFQGLDAAEARMSSAATQLGTLLSDYNELREECVEEEEDPDIGIFEIRDILDECRAALVRNNSISGSGWKPTPLPT